MDRALISNQGLICQRPFLKSKKVLFTIFTIQLSQGWRRKLQRNSQMVSSQHNPKAFKKCFRKRWAKGQN